MYSTTRIDVIHTRTNNVDTRVQGLPCGRTSEHMISPKKVSASDPNVFYLQRSLVNEMVMYHESRDESYLVGEREDW